MLIGTVTYFAYSIGDSYARISCLFHDLPVRAFDHLIARISLLLGSYLQFRKIKEAMKTFLFSLTNRP